MLRAGRLWFVCVVIELSTDGGLRLIEPNLWLDPPGPQPFAFVSHAHADHFARHERILCSAATAVIVRERFRAAASRLVPVPENEPFEHGGFRFRLLPAGHVTGSAMLYATRLRDGATLLYTGDFKLRRGRTAVPAQLVHADLLVMETTFGLPQFVLPPQLEIESRILQFVDESFALGATPVLVAYALGKAQEVVALLAEFGIAVVQHPSVARITEACRAVGVAALPVPMVWDGPPPPRHVLVAPPGALRSAALRALPARRTAMLTGWALQPGAQFRYRVDEAIPLSDHADHPGLMECVRRVRPQRVLTVHGYTREFAAELRRHGIEAWSAGGSDQLELPLTGGVPPAW